MKFLILFLLTGLLWLSDNGWYLDGLYDPKAPNNYFRAILFFIPWVLFVVVLVVKKKGLNQFIFTRVVYGLLFNVFFSTALGGIFVFNQSLSEPLLTLYRYGGITIYLVLSMLTRYINAKSVFKLILGYGVIQCVLVFLLEVVPDLKVYFNETIFSERFGITRIQGLTSIGGEFALCYFFSCFFVNVQSRFLSKRLVRWMGLLLTVFVFFAVAAARGFIIGFFLAVVLLAVLSFKAVIWNQRRLWIISGFLLFAVLLAFTSGALSSSDWIGSLRPNESTVENHNVAIRFQAAQFYFDQLLKTGFTGTGWISTKDDANNNAILDAINTNYYFAIDLGIFGTFCMFGLLSLVVYFWFYKTNWVLFLDITENGTPEEKLQACTIGMFLLLQLGTFTLGTLFYWPETACFYGLLMFVMESLWKNTAEKNQQREKHENRGH